VAISKTVNELWHKIMLSVALLNAILVNVREPLQESFYKRLQLKAGVHKTFYGNLTNVLKMRESQLQKLT
jgi:hypothetical protein